MITAKVVADSKNEFGNRLTTMVVTFPRIILAEMNTHRMMSRNSASSRAIPFEKMLKSVKENPFIPIAWQKDHSGMQGTEYFTTEDDKVALTGGGHHSKVDKLQERWLSARDRAVQVAKDLSGLGLTKQLCNRLLEPFMWHTVIVTASEWENFFYLRCPKYVCTIGDQKSFFRSRKDWVKHANEQKTNKHFSISDWDEEGWLKMNTGQAEIHMMALAEAMWDAFNESTPKELTAGEWHIPFGDNIDAIKCESMEEVIKVATARCARVSYTVVGEEGKEPNYENDIKLHDRLAASGHWSPFEHCAQAMSQRERMLLAAKTTIKNRETVEGFESISYAEQELGWSGNFRGFIQYRKTFNNENVTK